MTASIHQPMFLQYLGLFRKVAKSDVFVIYDTAQYSKNDWHNRNKIKTQNGATWLTVPVSYHLGDDFLTTKLADPSFIKSHLGIIEAAYRHAPYFSEIFPKLKAAYELPATNLAEFNLHLQDLCFTLLDLHPKIIRTSNLDLQGLRATEALVKICRDVGADTYLAGMDAGYMDLALFEKAGIVVKTNDFVARPYPQQFAGEFLPNLSVIDALFNIGPVKTRELITA